MHRADIADLRSWSGPIGRDELVEHWTVLDGEKGHLLA
jgi:hypothetical protein